MGFYVETGTNTGKAEAIARDLGGQIVTKEVAAAAINDPTKGVIVVVNNGLFEAAGFAFDKDEFEAFTSPNDHRQKKFVILDRAVAKAKSGYPASRV